MAKLWASGAANNFGQVGDGTVSDRSSAVQLGTLSTWSIAEKAVSSGNAHQGAIKNDGTLWLWGRNEYGDLGDGTTVHKSSPVQVAGTSWVALSCGTDATLALKTDGTLWGWGYNGFGGLGDSSNTHRSSPVQIGAGTDWATVAHGAYFSLAVKTDGTLWAWGNNASGQLGDGSVSNQNSPVQIGADTDWLRVSAGAQSSLAVKTDGTLWSWGNNTFGVLGLGDQTSRSSPTQVGSLTNWAAVRCSLSHHAVALKTDGTLWTWGFDGPALATGRMGDGTNTSKSSPVQIGSATWLQVACGYFGTIAIKSDQTLWGWGIHPGGTGNQNIPVQIGSVSTWTSASMGGSTGGAPLTGNFMVGTQIENFAPTPGAGGILVTDAGGNAPSLQLEIFVQIPAATSLSVVGQEPVDDDEVHPVPDHYVTDHLYYDQFSVTAVAISIPVEWRIYQPDNHDDFTCITVIAPDPMLGASRWTLDGKWITVGIYRDEGRADSDGKYWARDYRVFRLLPSFKLITFDELVALFEYTRHVQDHTTRELFDITLGDTVKIPSQISRNVFYELPPKPARLFSPGRFNQQYDHEGRPLPMTRPLGTTSYYANGQPVYQPAVTNRHVNNPRKLNTPRVGEEFIDDPATDVRVFVYDYYGIDVNLPTRAPWLATDIITRDAEVGGNVDNIVRRLDSQDNPIYPLTQKLFDIYGNIVIGIQANNSLTVRKGILPLALDRFNRPIKRPIDRGRIPRGFSITVLNETPLTLQGRIPVVVIGP